MIDQRAANRELHNSSHNSHSSCVGSRGVGGRIKADNNNMNNKTMNDDDQSSLVASSSSFPFQKSLSSLPSQESHSFFKLKKKKSFKKKKKSQKNKSTTTTGDCGSGDFNNTDFTVKTNSSGDLMLPDSSASRHNCDLVMQLLASGELDDLSVSSTPSVSKTTTTKENEENNDNNDDDVAASSTNEITNKSCTITGTTPSSSSPPPSPSVAITTQPPPSSGGLIKTKTGSFRVEVMLDQIEKVKLDHNNNMHRSKSCPAQTLMTKSNSTASMTKKIVGGILITSSPAAIAAAVSPDGKSKDKNQQIISNSSKAASTTSSTTTTAIEQATCHRRRKNKARVRFNTIEIREHFIMMGDNPGGFRGPPITIDWASQRCTTLPLDVYEMNRPPRRSSAQMNIPHHVRQDMLMQAGYSRGLIQEKVKEVNIARRQRKRTIETMKMTPFHEGMERMVRGSMNFTFRRGRKRRERDYIRQALKLHEQSVLENDHGRKVHDDDCKNSEHSSKNSGDGDGGDTKDDNYAMDDADDDEEEWHDMDPVMDLDEVNRG